jgi:hypothetical protein
LNYFAPLLAAGTAAVAIVVAPIAAAAPSDSTQPHQSCIDLPGSTKHARSSGSAEFRDDGCFAAT